MDYVDGEMKHDIEEFDSEFDSIFASIISRLEDFGERPTDSLMKLRFVAGVPVGGSLSHFSRTSSGEGAERFEKTFVLKVLGV